MLYPVKSRASYTEIGNEKDYISWCDFKFHATLRSSDNSMHDRRKKNEDRRKKNEDRRKKNEDRRRMEGRRMKIEGIRMKIERR